MILHINGTGSHLGRRLASFLRSMRPTILSSRKGKGDVFCDLSDLSSFQDFHAGDGDILVFLAAMSKPDFCAANPILAHMVNVENSAELVRRFTDAGARVLFFSSDAVYGDQEGTLSEEAPLKGREPYGMMKMEIERIFEEEPLFKALRLSYVVHENDDFTRYLQKSVQCGETASVFAGYARHMVCIDDVVATVDMALRDWQALPKTLNVGGPDCLSRAQVADLYGNAVFPGLEYREEEPPESFFQARPQRISLNTEKLRRFLGREPTRLADWLGGQRIGEN